MTRRVDRPKDFASHANRSCRRFPRLAHAVTEAESDAYLVKARALTRSPRVASPHARPVVLQSRSDLEGDLGAGWLCSDAPERSSCRGLASAKVLTWETSPQQRRSETWLGRGDLPSGRANVPTSRQIVRRSTPVVARPRAVLWPGRNRHGHGNLRFR